MKGHTLTIRLAMRVSQWEVGLKKMQKNRERNLLRKFLKALKEEGIDNANIYQFKDNLINALLLKRHRCC